jgi:methylglutamate dehydrogenase subunit D
MPDAPQRISPLARIAAQGRFGADNGAPGVLLSVPAAPALVLAIARRGGEKSLEAKLAGLKGVDVRWAGPYQYLVFGIAHTELVKKLRGIASCSDQSHGRAVIRIAGPKARATLAKGTPVDLHPNEFPRGKSAMTQMAHVGVHLTRTGDDVFELAVFRGFAESFWEWLTSQAAEFGYQVA